MNLKDELKRYFGFDKFRIGQEEIITDVIQQKNVLAMLPTGSGKSICYQLPALLLEGSTIVVSPLLSLMEDQVQQLKSNGIKRVVALNSFLTFEERKMILNNLHCYKIIYVSPEILQSSTVRNALKRIDVSLFVVDEAHCISQWGHDFRTDYLRLDELLHELKYPPCLAITATATKNVQNDIINQLRLTNVRKHIYSVDRKNIALQVMKTTTIAEKVEQIIELIQQLNGQGMIYFSSRKWAEAMTEKLKRAGNHTVAYYHGGMENEDRLLIQQQFLAGQLQTICCTSAFGMGINKPDVRYVIHFHYPGQIESYLQEIGRAGRDGKRSIAILFHCEEDAYITKNVMEMDLPNEDEVRQVVYFLRNAAQNGERITSEWEERLLHVTKLSDTKWRFLYYHLCEMGAIVRDEIRQLHFEDVFNTLQRKVNERLKVKRRQFQQMVDWLQTTSCRRANYLTYFDEQKSESIDYCCDICGFSIDDYFIKERNDEVITDTYNWKKELKRIFHQNIDDETDG